MSFLKGYWKWFQNLIYVLYAMNGLFLLKSSTLLVNISVTTEWKSKLIISSKMLLEHSHELRSYTILWHVLPDKTCAGLKKMQKQRTL